MANTYTSLGGLFTAIANAIRAKKGTTDTIVADNFPSEIESIADSCNNLARSIKRRNDGKSSFTEDQNHHVDHMFDLVSRALERMNYILTKQTLTHNDINVSYNIENEINTYRNQLKSRDIEDINNKLYSYQDGVYYMNVIGECEKVGDYVLNVVQALIEKKI